MYVCVCVCVHVCVYVCISVHVSCACADVGIHLTQRLSLGFYLDGRLVWLCQQCAPVAVQCRVC